MSERAFGLTWTTVVSVVFVALGTAYSFRWGSAVRHIDSLWISPPDLSSTFTSAVAFTHGHFGHVYGPDNAFLSFPGILVVLAPLAAFGSSFHTAFVAIAQHGHRIAVEQSFTAHTSRVWDTGTIVAKGGTEYAVQPQWFAAVAPYMLLVSCVALFALDALARHLGVERNRRTALCVAEAVILFPLVVFFGHAEDALAVGLVLYALVFALDDRFAPAGWLFGAALAVQPLVVTVLPVLLFLGGAKRVTGLLARGLAPAAVLTVAPLVAAFHRTTHSIASQPAFPLLPNNHVTPWTFLAPKLGGTGADTTVGGGPTRVVVLVLAFGTGWLVHRWRSTPAMVVWTVALALGIRVVLETVLTGYYVWPALAVALVVAALGSVRRFGTAVALALLTTVVAQWHLAWLPWWCLDVAGLAAVLLVSAGPVPPAAELAPPTRARRDPSGRARPKTSPVAAKRPPGRGAQRPVRR